MKTYQDDPSIKITALAGGVGGARLVDGLAQILPPQNLSVIVNTGDDFEHMGLFICPDLDTVCYTLAGLENPATGWGRSDESWGALESIAALGGPTWFHLGDRDIGLNLERTRRLRSGQTLSQVTRNICEALHVQIDVLPMSDSPIPTFVICNEGKLAFQEYFVRRQCQPAVKSFEFSGVEEAAPAAGVLEALRSSDLVVICPSNPWVSIDPILAVPGVRDAMKNTPVVAVSPIIGGQTIKGPAAKMFAELGIKPSSAAVAQHYQGLIKGFVQDTSDSALAASIREIVTHTLTTNTIMKSRLARINLAAEIIRFGQLLV